jgi:hypothetical protein
MVCLKFWVDLYMLHLPSATDEVSGKSWQVINAINHECDGSAPLWVTQGYDHTNSCHHIFCFAGTEEWLSSKCCGVSSAISQICLQTLQSLDEYWNSQGSIKRSIYQSLKTILWHQMTWPQYKFCLLDWNPKHILWHVGIWGLLLSDDNILAHPLITIACLVNLLQAWPEYLELW